MLWRYRKEIIDKYNKTFDTQQANLNTALLPFVSGSALRRLQNAIGYDIAPASPTDEITVYKEF